MSKSKKAEIVENKNVVQAVLIADNFTDNFSPVCDQLPVALLPFVNVPLIDYSLECLSLGGVEETFLFCCTHVDKIREHIGNSMEKKAPWTIRMKVNIIISESCQSLGDALRDLDAKGLIRSDFILLNADTVANINFLPILQNHIATAKRDKGAAMTLIFQNVGSRHRRFSHQENVLIVSDTNNRILYHKKVSRSRAKKTNFPLEIFLENSRVSIRNNLRDTHVAICSPSVLPLFSDNFDFQTRDDFVRGLLMNEEILGCTLYWHQLAGSEYASRVTNWEMYQVVSHDVIHRWAYPLVPDMNLSSQQTYVFTRHHVYRHRDVKLAKGSHLLEDVVIAKGSSVDESTEVSRAVIGDNCKIGKNVKICDSYILPNSVIKDNCVVSNSFVGPNCAVGRGCKILLGSILGPKVQLKDGATMEGVVLQSNEPSDCKKEDKMGTRCYRLRSVSQGEENSDSELEGNAKQVHRFLVESESSDSESESEASSLSDEQMSHMASPVPDDTNLFLTEVIDSLARGFEDKLQCDNLILEINSSRYAYNVTVREQSATTQPYLLSLHCLLTYFTPILINYIRNDAAMLDCLQAIEEVAETCSELNECVAKVLHWFYEKDVLSEDAILQWHSKLNPTTRLFTRTQPFIQWLQEADEETDSETD